MPHQKVGRGKKSAAKRMKGKQRNENISPSKAKIFHDYRLVRDGSWLRRDQTFEEANREMQDSISRLNSISGVACLWVDDLKSTSRVDTSASRNNPRERMCNSFLQYRILVHRCFRGQQTDISKEVETLWRNESKEMRFYCLRNSEIETRISPYQ